MKNGRHRARLVSGLAACLFGFLAAGYAHATCCSMPGCPGGEPDCGGACAGGTSCGCGYPDCPGMLNCDENCSLVGCGCGDGCSSSVCAEIFCSTSTGPHNCNGATVSCTCGQFPCPCPNRCANVGPQCANHQCDPCDCGACSSLQCNSQTCSVANCDCGLLQCSQACPPKCSSFPPACGSGGYSCTCGGGATCHCDAFCGQLDWNPCQTQNGPCWCTNDNGACGCPEVCLGMNADPPGCNLTVFNCGGGDPRGCGLYCQCGNGGHVCNDQTTRPCSGLQAHSCLCGVNGCVNRCGSGNICGAQDYGSCRGGILAAACAVP